MENIIRDNKEDLKNGCWVLHWDGKTLKKVTHAGKKKSVLAIILNASHKEEEILLDVINMKSVKHGASEETDVIYTAIP